MIDSIVGMFREIAATAIGGFLASFLFLYVQRRDWQARGAPAVVARSETIARIDPPTRLVRADRPRARSGIFSRIFLFLLGVAFTMAGTFIYFFSVFSASLDASEQHHQPTTNYGVVVIVPCLILLFLSGVRAQRRGRFWRFWLWFIPISLILNFLLIMAYVTVYGSTEVAGFYPVPNENTVALQVGICALLIELVTLGYSMPDPPLWIPGRRMRADQ